MIRFSSASGGRESGLDTCDRWAPAALGTVIRRNMPMRDEQAAAPQVLGGRYELRHVVGRGGMSVVYEGFDRLLERTVAVKVLSPPYDQDPGFVVRFGREARAAAGFSHPNVASVFDTGSDDGTRYIVMEYVEGRTLADVLRREGPIPPERAVAVARSICEALEAAHHQGLVHRDVKPGNVMLTARGEVKVLDFGIVKAVSGESRTRTGLILGTASYLSPEQAQGRPVDARSDLYSLGCVLYEMLAGRPPFIADHPVAVAAQHVAEEPPPLSSMSPNVPGALEAVVMRALAKQPTDRFGSAREMGVALDHAAEQLASGSTSERP